MVVVKWSACSLLLKQSKSEPLWSLHFSVKIACKKTKINKKRPGLALFKKHLPSEYANSSTLGLVWPDRAIFKRLGGKNSYQSRPNICEHFGCSEKHILWNNCTFRQLFRPVLGRNLATFYLHLVTLPLAQLGFFSKNVFWLVVSFQKKNFLLLPQTSTIRTRDHIKF